MIEPCFDGSSAEVGSKRDAMVGSEVRWRVGDAFAVKAPVFASTRRI